MEKRQDGSLVCDIMKRKDMDNFFTTPCYSKLNIIACFKDFRKSKRKKLVKKELYSKAVFLQHSDEYVLFPIIHDMEKK